MSPIDRRVAGIRVGRDRHPATAPKGLHRNRPARARLASLAAAVAVTTLAAPAPAAGGGVAPLPAEARVFRADPTAPQPLLILSYHDVRDDLPGDLSPDRFAVSTERLVQQLDWLQANGYVAVSVDELVAAREGRGTLPPRPVLLTFDDGLKSVYTHVFPILKLFDLPAVVAVVGSWMDADEEWSVEYAEGTLRREGVVEWSELREMHASGLVEIASHSHDLHQGVHANAWGNEQPAAVTRIRSMEDGEVEDEESYLARIRADLVRSSERIREEIGVAPRVVVWPYGEYSRTTEAIAGEVGMILSMGLESARHPATDFSGMARMLVMGNPPLGDFVWMVEHRETARRPIRVAQVDMDYVFDPDSLQIERNIDRLIERIHAMGVTHVYLQAFANPSGDGTAEALYFPNRHMPMRADLFNRVAWQLRTRAEVEVFGWLPLLAFDLGSAALNDSLSVKRWENGRLLPSRPDFRRLSPYEPEARRIILEIYEDLAISSPLHGLLFHDDAYLNDSEDAAAFGDGRLPTAAEKTETLIAFSLEVKERVERWRPRLRTARNLYARVALEPESEAWFAQSLPRFVESYDQTALMAMPRLEGASDREGWLMELADSVAAVPLGPRKVVFELQSFDWRDRTPVPAEELAAQMRGLQRRGFLHFGYYPEDFVAGRPEMEVVRPAISVEHFPYRRP